MEISKLTFENSKQININKSFEELDVNADGVINEIDATTIQDVELSKNITNLLASIDEETKLSEIASDDEITENTDTTPTTLGTLSEEDKAKLAALKEELKTLNADIAKLNADIQTLVAKNKELEEEKARLEEEQKEAQIEADDKNEKLATEQRKLEMYSREYDDYQMKLDKLNSEILLEQGRAEEEFNDSMSNLVNKVVNEYDPKEHGDNFNAYFERKMSEQGYPTFAVLDTLNFQAKNVSNNASAVLFNIRSQSSVVASAKSAADIANSTLTSVTNNLNNVITEINTNNSQIESLQGTLATKQTRKAEVTQEIAKIRPIEEKKDLLASEILEKISEKEKCFAKELGWDLRECIVALGLDNQFHIYNPKVTDVGWALCSTRAYFLKTQGFAYSQESYNITPVGSGALMLYQEFAADDETKNGRPIYRFNCVNEDWTDGEVCESAGCYMTCTPLAFDVEHDGITTTKETINYDIDGDGRVDIVNDSADWVLAFDKDKDGIAGENGSELFGDNTDLDGDGVKDGYKDGFAALKALAEKEGLIDNIDRKLNEADLKLLSEKYGLTMKKGYQGETKNFDELRITEINLSTVDFSVFHKNFDGRNNDLLTQSGATFVVNGKTSEYADILNSKKASFISPDIEEIKPIEKIDLVEANIKETKFELKLNKNNILALKGNVDVQSIKNKAMNKAEAPKNIFEEIIEIEEEDDNKK